MQEHLRKLTPIPRGLSLKKALTRERLEALQNCILALAEGGNLETGLGLQRHCGNGKVKLDLDLPTRKFFPVYGPFTPLFSIVDPAAFVASYTVKVTDGVVIDRETNSATLSGGGTAIMPDGVILWKCDNRLDVNGEMAEFPIQSGDSVWVCVTVQKSGAVGSVLSALVCSIVVGKITGSPAVGKSAHWFPPIEEDVANPLSAGADGTYFYKLATLTVDPSGEMKVENFCAGDNIQHFRELPKFGHLGYGQPIFKQYNPVTGMYEYYSIAGISPVTVQRVNDTLQIGLSGTYTDQVVVKALPAGITGKERPQVNVHDDGVVAGVHGYTVKGNGTDGSLEIFNCERVSLFKLVWRDGLITDSIVNHDDGAGDTVLRLRTCAEGLSSFSTLP